ncbi:MAG: glycosyltransferase [Phycisphaeraceae bacterium]|nr:glycosyltransferase [Phycisphaeraceae bacterium]
MRFAIVTPTLNSGTFLRDTVHSVLATLGPEDTYTIVDGGSTDGSVDALRASLPPRVQVLRDSGGGMYEAIAQGFAATPGSVMAWINASDVLLRGALERVREAFRASNAELLYFDDLAMNEEGVIQQRTIGTVQAPLRAMRAVGWTPLQDACFWTRELYERCGGVNREMRLAGDFDFFLRAFHAGRAHYMPGIVSAFRHHAGQLSRARSGAYRDEVRLARQRFDRAQGLSPIGALTHLRLRAALSFRARSGAGSRSTPWAGRPWREVEASLT